MRKLLVLLFLFITILPSYGSSRCFLTQPLIAYDDPNRLAIVCKSAVASQNTEQMLSIFSVDIHAGAAILLPKGSLIHVEHVTPMITTITTQGLIYYTITQAIFCK